MKSFKIFFLFFTLSIQSFLLYSSDSNTEEEKLSYQPDSLKDLCIKKIKSEYAKYCDEMIDQNIPPHKWPIIWKFYTDNDSNRTLALKCIENNKETKLIDVNESSTNILEKILSLDFDKYFIINASPYIISYHHIINNHLSFTDENHQTGDLWTERNKIGELKKYEQKNVSYIIQHINKSHDSLINFIKKTNNIKDLEKNINFFKNQPINIIKSKLYYIKTSSCVTKDFHKKYACHEKDPDCPVHTEMINQFADAVSFLLSQLDEATKSEYKKFVKDKYDITMMTPQLLQVFTEHNMFEISDEDENEQETCHSMVSKIWNEFTNYQKESYCDGVKKSNMQQNEIYLMKKEDTLATPQRDYPKLMLDNFPKNQNFNRTTISQKDIEKAINEKNIERYKNKFNFSSVLLRKYR